MTEERSSSTHPQLPPTTEDERFSWLRLLRSRRVGATTFHRLLADHGSAQAALEALPEVARAAGVDDYSICPEGVVAAEIKAGRAAGARLIFHGEPTYPAALADLADAPPFLWALGDVGLLGRPMVALVGARNASSLGLRMARRLATDLSEAGYVIVSGLARGIDAAAHAGSLPGGTIAVQAGGVDVIYPSENADLAHEIGARGLRLSEQPMGLQPQARHFPTRNRIVSGLAQAVVVVEAAAKSGSLISAEAALAQGREVLAVPGHPFDARASGCNMLIRDGATLVRSAADVITALGVPVPAPAPAATPRAVPPPPAPRTPRPGLRAVAALHRQILDRLGPSPLAEDQLIRDLKVSPGTVAPVLIDLELDGRIARQPGGLLSRTD
ncbi:MAG: DNA-protecting protein DprA [Limimaricola sp.]|uniref:DNA-processing protein DprA n=1 Tax=Limimaricola sp. TaxID=2211665 RepID=UPI001DCF703E|nr:DNA-processing protein DprA [Limimaricola sp.]MBI1419011.1 DNA-protecting protein DprA [Limimaricola sp.]